MYTLLIKELWNAERWMEANFAAVKYITHNSNHSKDESFDINLYNACITGGGGEKILICISVKMNETTITFLQWTIAFWKYVISRNISTPQ